MNNSTEQMPNPPQASTRERARVVMVDRQQNAGKAQVWVEVVARSSCGSCSASAACGQGVLSRWFQRKARCYPVECEQDQAALLSVGRWVEVEIPDGVLVRASLLVFLYPLLGMLLGAALFNAFYNHDLGVALGGVAGFLAGFAFARGHASGSGRGLQQPRLCSLE